MSFGVGNHNLNSQLRDGTNLSGIGILDNIGYSFFLDKNWALHLGFGIKTFRSSTNLNATDSISNVDSEGQSYQHKTKYSSLMEDQKAIMLMFPISVEYYYPLYKTMDIYSSLGVEVDVPQQVSYEIASGEIESRGYYKDYNVELFNLPQHNFGSIASDYGGDVKMANSLSVLGELGGMFHLSQQLSLIIAGYFTYGINNTLITENKPLFSINRVYSGMFNSDKTSNVNLISYGAKLAICWRIEGTKK